MSDDHEAFAARLERIKAAQNYRVGRPVMVRPDGLIVPRDPQPRLRFVFPLKGLIIAFCAAVAVKAYLIWFLGGDTYSVAVMSLLNGSPLERVAGQILAPDGVSLWLVGKYETLAFFLTEMRG